jgi:hypothetical protein
MIRIVKKENHIDIVNYEIFLNHMNKIAYTCVGKLDVSHTDSLDTIQSRIDTYLDVGISIKELGKAMDSMGKNNHDTAAFGISNKFINSWNLKDLM